MASAQGVPIGSSKIQAGVIGTSIRVRVKHRDENGNLVTTNVSSATTRELKLKAATGEEQTQNAGFATDGSDGLIEYITDSTMWLGIPNPAGWWQAFLYLDMAGWEGPTEVGHFEVLSVPF